MIVKNKPIELEAFKFTLKKKDKEPKWFLKEIGNKVICKQNGMKQEWYIVTFGGPVIISKGDYVVRDVQGEMYPVKPDVFDLTYEILEDE